MPLVLGITGSIATGKSLLCEHLVAQHGAIHGDADKIVHRMYDPGKPGFDRIVEEFSDEIVDADGYIDRKVLGSMVFGKPERMGALTTAIGDIAAEMKQTIEGWREDLPDDGIAILEAVNLIEAGYSAWTDATWLVAADDEVALPRLMERNAFSEEEARQRLDSARDWKLREPASDRVFLNNTTTEQFLSSIDDAIEETQRQLLDGTLPDSRFHEWWEDTREEREARAEQIRQRREEAEQAKAEAD
jgi:dephospho-CoA kinase